MVWFADYPSPSSLQVVWFADYPSPSGLQVVWFAAHPSPEDLNVVRFTEYPSPSGLQVVWFAAKPSREDIPVVFCERFVAAGHVVDPEQARDQTRGTKPGACMRSPLFPLLWGHRSGFALLRVLLLNHRPGPRVLLVTRESRRTDGGSLLIAL